MLQLTLTPMREDQARYWVLVSYERALDRVAAIRRTYEWLETRPGHWTFMVTRITELRRPPGGRLAREWPRKIDQPAPETENLRRARIMALRARVHVDPAKGAAEPDWDRAAPQ